jgi:nucleotide-binding universal stress UspA family protein
MYRNILLAYDGTLEGRVALREGALLAKQCDAKVVLLAVVDPVPQMSVVGDAAIAFVPRYQTQDVQNILDEGVARLSRLGLAHTALLRTADPATCIVDVANEVGADLVVVGHHKQGALARWLIGSLTGSLIDRLNCSLLIGRRDVSEEELFATSTAQGSGARGESGD